MAMIRTDEPSAAPGADLRYHCALLAPGVGDDVKLDRLVVGGDALFSAYWRAADGARLTAAGVVYETRFTGSDAVLQAQRAWSELCGRLAGDAAAQVRAFCGFAFAPGAPRDEYWREWPDGLLVLPEWLVWQRPSGSRIVVRISAVRSGQSPPALEDVEAQWRRFAVEDGTAQQRFAAWALPVDAVAERVSPERVETVDRAAWCRSVQDAATAVQKGRLDKVVLARRERLRWNRPIPVDRVLRALERDYPEATVFAVRLGEQMFVGATPERLVSLAHGQVAVDCLAGTAVRGADEAADEDLARRLLISGKDRVEHDAVVRGVRDDLSGVVERLESPSCPQIRRLKNVSHLFTPMSGVPRAGVTAFSLLARLHPTPAVAGLPREAAIDAIARWETADRGWYAAPIGWVDTAQEGEFVVALRSALIVGQEALLYAGVGVVADSCPENEWAETEWKFSPMRTALQDAANEEERRSAR